MQVLNKAHFFPQAERNSGFLTMPSSFSCSGTVMRNPEEYSNIMEKKTGNAPKEGKQHNTEYDRKSNMDTSGREIQSNVPERHDITKSISAVESFVETYEIQASGK